MMVAVREFREVVTADGRHFVFTNGHDRYQVFMTGMGIPPIVRTTERGYNQDGRTVVEKHLDERTITLQLYAQACSRQAYDRLRDEIIDAMRPNRGEPLTLRVRRANGDFFEIDIEAEGEVLGGDMPAIDNLVDETFIFKAAYPIWRRVPSVETQATLTITRHLVYPFVYPTTALYGSQTVTISLPAINYEGSYKSFPTIVIVGPASSLFVQNLTLGKSAAYVFPIPDGVTVTIEFTQEGPILTSTNGVDYSGYLTSDSEPLEVVIAPEGIDVPGGINDIRISVGGATADTLVTLIYDVMKIGV